MHSKQTMAQQALLLLAGGLLMAVGGSIHLAPATFYAANGIEPTASISLLNELKAPAGFLLAAGSILILAVFRPALREAATLLAALIYLSYALSRGLSMWMDGMPTEGLMQAAALEGLVGLACLGMWATNHASMPACSQRKGPAEFMRHKRGSGPNTGSEARPV
ncbi:MAG: DUF4345 domain-containing protein [Gammaproteobacteria bacterium]